MALAADVVVVGAGVAGLSAARDLSQAGLDVEVIEARPRIGGRVLTVRDPSLSIPLELGAEFVHGSAAHTTAVLREAGLAVCDVAGDRWVSTRHGLRPLEDFWERLDVVMSRLGATRRRDRSFAEFLAEWPGGPSHARERRLASQWVRGFHAADPARVSARALADGGSPGGDESEQRQARVLGGYDRVVAHLAGALRREPRLGTIVTSVEWAAGGVELALHDARRDARSMLSARSVVLAVSLGVLQAPADGEGAIVFAPQLPPAKRHALRCLTEGHVQRVSIVLDEPLWVTRMGRSLPRGRSLGRLSFIHPDGDDMPVCWTAYPTDAPVLVAWFGGPAAESLAARPEREIHDAAVAGVARRLGIARRSLERHLRACYTHNWSADPFSRGAYSYVLVGGTGSAAARARPVAGTLFFAGEAFDAEGRNGTVDGAIASGRRAARQVIRALGAR